MTPKKLREEKRRAARLRNTMRHKEKEEALQKDLEEEIVDDPIEDVESVEKDYYSAPDMMPVPGPTSWDELDTEKVARDKAAQVREVTWNTQDLVNNILYSDMPPENKAKAIQSVGDGFGNRLKMAEKHENMEKEYDLDLLETEAILARDARHLSVIEKVTDWFQKAKLTAAKEDALDDSDFALVVTRDGKKVRKYPIHDKAHVRNALARAAQMMNEGGEAAKDAKAALPKIRAAAKKFGIGTMEKSNSAIVIEKDASEHWRAVMWPSNNFIDLDGDILSEVAHKEFVEWVGGNMELAPVFMTWHLPETVRKNRVDYVGYENGFLLMSAPLEENEAAALLKAQTITDLGMSHGTIVLERDPSDPRVVTKYRMVEVSDLPLKYAANPFTDFETIMKEAEMSKALDTKAYLETILGKEKAEEYLKKAGIKQKALQDAGVESKEKKEEVPAPASTPETPSVEELTAQVFERVRKELDVEGLSAYLEGLQESTEKVAVLEALVKELTEKREDELAEMIAAPAGKALVWQKERASKSEKTVLDEKKPEDEKLKKAKPELGWLSEATGTQPIP